MAVKQLSDGNPDGTVLGQGDDDPIAFYGKTAVTRRSLPASIGASATTAILKAAINKIRNLLDTLGLGEAQ